MPGVVDKAAHNGKCAPAKKATKKAIDEDVVVRSSDGEKEKLVNRCKPVQGSRKEVKTLTSILTARSKVSLEVNPCRIVHICFHSIASVLLWY